MARAIFTALSVRLVVVALTYPGFLVPGREHWEFAFETGKIARSIVLGHGFGNPYYGGDTGPTAGIAPVLPYVLAGIFALAGIYTKAAALAMLSLNSLFSALTCIPIFYSAKKSFGFQEARWAVWAWAFFPYAINLSANSMWDHALVALLLSCILWVVLQLQESPRKWAWAGFGFLCGLSALTNPVVLGILPFLGGWACYRLHRSGRAWMAAALTAAAVLGAVIAPWLIRNCRTFHRAVFLKDNFPLELSVGNVGNAVHWWNGSLHPSGNDAELDEYHRLGEQAYMAGKWVQARDSIEKYPGTFVWRSTRRFVYMWTGYWSFDREYLREERFDLENIPFCLATTVLALIGLRKKLRQHTNSAIPYALMLLVFPLPYYITHPEMAYRHPVDPEVITLACCAIVSWLPAVQRSTVQEAATAATDAD